MNILQIRSFSLLLLLLVLTPASARFVSAQETPPAPGAPKTGTIPVVKDKRLANGLTVAVGERRSMPLVTIQLLVKSGAGNEGLAKAGLANLTAALLTKGTKTRTATQIAEQIEFLGGSIGSGAGWNASSVNVTVTSDKIEQALAILADVVLNPVFKQEELDLLKTQTLDGLTYNLKQPGFIANYVATRYTYGEHPLGGTPESLKSLARKDVTEFHKQNYRPENAVLIFAGDITEAKANSSARSFFSKWKAAPKTLEKGEAGGLTSSAAEKTAGRILVVDLPNSGQAAIKYVKTVSEGRVSCSLPGVCRTSDSFFPAIAMNSVLGGGYSSRLNQEIRIKRGLSYGAGSNLDWRGWHANFGTSTQTKSESAAEVAELVLAEVERLGDAAVEAAELDPRKLVLSGDFGRDLETTAGLAERIADLYSFDLRPIEMNAYVTSVQSVTSTQISEFASTSLRGGDIIIVGDAKLFAEDLKKRFPDMTVTTIAADELDISRESLRK